MPLPVAIVLCLILSGYLGLVAGVKMSSDADELDACARQHNVYACHMVAVPTQKEEER